MILFCEFFASDRLPCLHCHSEQREESHNNNNVGREDDNH